MQYVEGYRPYRVECKNCEFAWLRVLSIKVVETGTGLCGCCLQPLLVTPYVTDTVHSALDPDILLKRPDHRTRVNCPTCGGTGEMAHNVLCLLCAGAGRVLPSDIGIHQPV